MTDEELTEDAREDDTTPEQGDPEEFDAWAEANFDEGDRFFLIPEYRGWR